MKFIKINLIGAEIVKKGSGLISSIITLLIVAGFVSNLSAQNSNVKRENQSSVEAFYKSFSGKIGKESFRVDLYFIDGELFGKYHTQNKSTDLKVITSPDKTDEPWILAENTADSIKKYTWKFWVTKEIVRGVVLDNTVGSKTKGNLTEDYPKGVSQFAMHAYHKTIALFPEDSESPLYNIELIFPSPKNATQTNHFLNDEIKKIVGLGEEYSFAKGVEEKLMSLEQEYKQGIDDEFGEQREDVINDWQFSQIVTIAFNEKGYLVLSDYSQEYSGGAHDYQHRKYYGFDLQNQKPLHLENLTTIDTVELQNLLENQFRKDFDLSSDENLDDILFENYLKPGENFRFDKQGIYFVYNPYEVGPYSLQGFEVFISYKDLKGALVREFAKRMGLSPENAMN